MAVADKQIQAKERWAGNMTHFAVITASDSGWVGFDISHKDFALKAVPENTISHSELVWQSLDDDAANTPMKVLRQWLVDRQTQFFADDYISVWESLWFIIQEDEVTSKDSAMILLWDVTDQECKLVLFRPFPPAPPLHCKACS